ncbi:hypothetical protein, partial [Parachitinimonas caeni]
GFVSGRAGRFLGAGLGWVCAFSRDKYANPNDALPKKSTRPGGFRRIWACCRVKNRLLSSLSGALFALYQAQIRRNAIRK